MSRRKFTMLEAFQVSAKESADRAAEERRRLVLEREKEIRREESHRAAEDLRRRVGGGVGAWISGVLGDDEEPAPAQDRDAGPPPENPGESADSGRLGDSADPTGAVETASAVESSGDPASAVPIDRSPPSVFDQGAGGPRGDGEGDGGVASVSVSDENDAATRSVPPAAEVPSVETLVGSDAATWEAPEVPSAGEPSSGVASAAASDSEARSGFQGRSQANHGANHGASPGASGASLAGPSGESAALPAEAAAGVAVPMSAKGFVGLLVLLAAGVFAIGYGLGRRAESPDLDVTPQGSPASGADLGSFGAPPARPASPGLSGSGLSGSGEGLTPSDGVPATVADITPPAVTSPAPSEPSPGTTDADRAFMDPKMRFTVLAITYPNSPDRQAMAWNTYDLLAEKGFPVVRPAVKDARIHVLVGASARLAELDTLVTEIRSLRVGRSGRNEFRSAYKVNIEDFR